MKKVEYDIEQSPFYSLGMRTRATLKELKANKGEEIVLARKRYFKRDEYIKFIVNTEYDIKEYDKLSPLSKTVLQYILYECLEYNTPTFRFKVESFLAILEYSESYVHKALRELVKANYIAKTRTKEVYWINHNKYYKGNFMIDKFIKQK